MTAKANLTKVANLSVTARELDFVSRFTTSWQALMDILGIMRPIEKQPGTILRAYTAAITLQPGNVAEGDEIPYSLATVQEALKTDLTLEKYAKAVSIEAVTKYGAPIAIQKTDDALLNELQITVMNKFYTFLQTGSLTGVAGTFQAAVAKSIGLVRNKFKQMHKTTTAVVTFVNILDAYDYLGSANITIQNQFGMLYIENFMGADRVILSAEIPTGTVISTPVENIDLYYINPANSDFAQLGLDYTVDGVTNLIGFHAAGNYSHAVGECYALMGMAVWAEYLDGIAVVTVEASGSLASISGFSTAAGTAAVGDSVLTVPDPTVSGGKYYFKAQASTAPSAPTYLAQFDTTGWTEVVDDQVVSTTNGHKYRVVEINGAGQAIATTDGTVVAKTA